MIPPCGTERGRRRRRSAPALLAVAALVLTSCATEYRYVGAFRRADLAGVVYPASGGAESRGVAGARISLNGEEEVVADSRGRFLLPRVRIGGHRLEVRREGYLPVERRIEFLNRSEIVYVRLLSVEEARRQAVRAYESGRLDRAEDLARRLVEYREGDLVGRYLLAARALARGRASRGLGHLRRLSRPDRRRPPVTALRRELEVASLRPGPSP